MHIDPIFLHILTQKFHWKFAGINKDSNSTVDPCVVYVPFYFLKLAAVHIVRDNGRKFEWSAFCSENLPRLASFFTGHICPMPSDFNISQFQYLLLLQKVFHNKMYRERQVLIEATTETMASTEVLWLGFNVKAEGKTSSSRDATKFPVYAI